MDLAIEANCRSGEVCFVKRQNKALRLNLNFAKETGVNSKIVRTGFKEV